MSAEPLAMDVVMVGCGLVGAPLALALADAGYRVLTLDKSTPEPLPEHRLDQRCTALSASTESILSHWGLWHSVSAIATPIKSVHVSQKGYFGVTRLQAEEQQVTSLGHVIENRRYQHLLTERLERSSVEQLMPARFISMASTPASCTVAYQYGEQQQSVQAKLVIAVDGVGSAVREAAGISSTQYDYDQHALLTTVQLNQSHRHVAYERFTECGPLAVLPSYEQTASVVCCLDGEQMTKVGQMDDVDLLAYLQKQFGWRLGRWEAVGQRVLLPLIRMEADCQHAGRVVLLGNALRLLHPVAGQGYNLAMRDASALLSHLDPKDPGDPALLSAFAEARQSDQQKVVQLTDTLARVFRGRQPVMGHLRALGLLGLDTVSPLRNQFAHKALGFTR
ncbi:MAG: FAD-dependent monooxygenase [Gammaproteobacteria bacterium]|nr:FAD-dependent monooxygenase [Gammaproteobacteria bacterium]